MSEEKIKPKTDSELFQSCTNQCVREIFENNSGAGANAASRVDLTIAATDPLSEIVYSPDKGLILKCADSSFADKNNSLFRDVGPSSMVLALPQSFIGDIPSTDKQPIDVVFVKPIAVICTKSNIAATDIPTMHPTSDSGVMPQCEANEENDTGSGGNMEKMNTAERAPNAQYEHLMNYSEKNTCDQASIGTDKIFDMEGNKFSTIPGQVDQMSFGSLLLQSDEQKHSMEQNPSPMRCSNEGIDVGKGKKALVIDDALYAAVEPIIECKGSGAPGTNLASSSRSPLEKLESTTENDLQISNVEAVCAMTSGVIVNEIKNKSEDNEMMLPCDNILPVSHSPCHSRIHMRINKGKEKSLSDGDAKVRLSKEENDSNSSVESCNSTGSFSTGKKRCNFPQQLIIGSKRVQNQIQETFGSKSYVERDSSFMNWISNIVKGLSQSIQDGPITSAHTLANPDPNVKLVTCNTNQNCEPKNTGFKSIFQSLYCTSLKNVGTRKSHQEGEGCDDLEPGNMVHGIEATPLTCCAERYEAGPSSQHKIKPLNFLNSHEIIKDKEEMASHSSSTRQNTNNTENVDSITLSDRKEAGNIYHKSDNTLGSLWITRFSPKSTAPLVNSDHLNERVGSQVGTTGSSKLPNDSNTHISYLSNCKIEQTREQSGDEKGVSTCLKEDKGNIDQKPKHKFIPLSSSTGFRNSKPMTSMFARRLGAIKHIPASRTISTTQVNTSCLFCGTIGHQLSDCSGIEESELKDLQKNMNLHGGLEDLPCICIKCFQPNHWAISCRTSTSTRKHELEVNALVNDCIPSGERISPSNEGSARLLTSSCKNDETDHKEERNLNLKRKSNEVITSKAECYASFKKYCSASSEENKFKENSSTSPSRLAERQISHIPKGISDAVKKLRLSRTDILK